MRNRLIAKCPNIWQSKFVANINVKVLSLIWEINFNVTWSSTYENQAFKHSFMFTLGIKLNFMLKDNLILCKKTPTIHEKKFIIPCCIWQLIFLIWNEDFFLILSHIHFKYHKLLPLTRKFFRNGHIIKLLYKKCCLWDEHLISHYTIGLHMALECS